MRGKDAVEAHEWVTRGRDEGAESRQKLNRAQHAMRLVAARFFDLVRDAAVREHAEALEAQRGSSAVAQQSLAAFTVRRRDGNAGVNVEAARGASPT